MQVLSVFCDEAGQQDMSYGYYLLTLVLHDQAIPLDEYVSDYESHLLQNGLANIPLHMKDLLHGHGNYDGMSLEERRRQLVYFNIFMQKLPVRYRTFAYSSYDTSARDLSARMRRDIVNYIYDNPEQFQSFGSVRVCYDEGQKAVTRAMHEAFDYMLGEGAADYRLISCQDRGLALAADYLCTIELASLRYGQGSESSTYRKLFGLKGDFKRNYLKQARRKHAWPTSLGSHGGTGKATVFHDLRHTTAKYTIA